MYAKFYRSGKVSIYNSENKLLVSGIPGVKSWDEKYDILMDFSVALMKFKGDWPKNPLREQTIQLVDNL